MGIITGAGLGNLLDPVKERLKEQEITLTQQVIDIIKDERADLPNRYTWVNEDLVQESLKTTAWMLTYVGYDMAIVPTRDDVRLRLAFPVPEKDYQFALISPDTAWIFPPTGTTDEQNEQWHRFCNDQLQILTDETDVTQHIVHHIGIAARLLNEVAEANDGVSTSFQVGLHFLPIRTRVSNIVGPDLRLTWQSDDA